MKKLGVAFYARKDVVEIARELVGKVLVTDVDGHRVSGRIVETEAYVGLTDKASHSYAGKRTSRNEHMYAGAGTTYVYICYGMHQMLNIVTNDKDIPDAILIRALEPIDGIDVMLQRTGKPQLDNTLTRGPGNVAKALGVSKKHSGLLLSEEEISIYEDKGSSLSADAIGESKRIGIDSAGADSELPYRFYVRGNKFVSGRPTK